jgi:hypothetical protein
MEIDPQCGLVVPVLGPGCSALADRTARLISQPILAVVGIGPRLPLAPRVPTLVGVCATPAGLLWKRAELEAPAEFLDDDEEDGGLKVITVPVTAKRGPTWNGSQR